MNGWLGYGSSLAAGSLAEPNDTNYGRQPISFGTLDRTTLVDLTPGTVGPASVAWGAIGFIGVFDAQSGGNLLFWLTTSAPLSVAVGGSITSSAGSLRMVFPELGGSSPLRVWPTGAVVANTVDGRPVTVGVPLQFAGGVISAQVPTFGTTVSMGSLPQSQPVSGTGQLWNNGGVISVA
ncbi:hypothetical protein NFI95_04915 [Acetobacteraceae bacterium KSS8]|uniref:Uncharacterized protein n=1 Tax=Endosaccharibacter trunci TaxID=2812733 RepID=A0ABT1W4H9_9PROT|nr:hypothetical protein [Acetobacteraceae bacterium KSS8]